MQRTRFLMIGGFLGAGKTTALARLAHAYTKAGLRVGLVTNDQAHGLVDTFALKAQGFQVGEVAGACFCCQFNELVDTLGSLSVDQQPDVVLTEPVGSCTDLLATVIEPLRHLHGDRYELGPLTVLCKPEHGQRILGKSRLAAEQGRRGGFSPQAAYIFTKQLEEAQLICLNKVDKLSKPERDELLGQLRDQFPGKRLLALSSLTGEGYESLVQALAETPSPSQIALTIDYDTYAQGEAELGWLNATVELAASDSKIPTTSWDLDACLQQFANGLRDSLLQSRLEPGHVKLLVSSGSQVAMMHWVASHEPVEFSLRSEAHVTDAQLLINARVAGDPDVLTQIVQQLLASWARSCQLTCTISHLEHLRPGRPVPVHRWSGEGTVSG
jgi:Ni2+-binding GTPase involved in maturation of urease and hydrogenase